LSDHGITTTPTKLTTITKNLEVFVVLVVFVHIVMAASGSGKLLL
jgi:hypothetical protein